MAVETSTPSAISLLLVLKIPSVSLLQMGETNRKETEGNGSVPTHPSQLLFLNEPQFVCLFYFKQVTCLLHQEYLAG